MPNLLMGICGSLVNSPLEGKWAGHIESFPKGNTLEEII
jgi:hypothetical protein